MLLAALQPEAPLPGPQRAVGGAADFRRVACAGDAALLDGADGTASLTGRNAAEKAVEEAVAVAIAADCVFDAAGLDGASVGRAVAVIFAVAASFAEADGAVVAVAAAAGLDGAAAAAVFDVAASFARADADGNCVTTRAVAGTVIGGAGYDTGKREREEMATRSCGGFCGVLWFLAPSAAASRDSSIGAGTLGHAVIAISAGGYSMRLPGATACVTGNRVGGAGRDSRGNRFGAVMPLMRRRALWAARRPTTWGGRGRGASSSVSMGTIADGRGGACTATADSVAGTLARVASACATASCASLATVMGSVLFNSPGASVVVYWLRYKARRRVQEGKSMRNLDFKPPLRANKSESVAGSRSATGESVVVTAALDFESDGVEAAFAS